MLLHTQVLIFRHFGVFLRDPRLFFGQFTRFFGQNAVLGVPSPAKGKTQPARHRGAPAVFFQILRTKDHASSRRRLLPPGPLFTRIFWGMLSSSWSTWEMMPTSLLPSES